MMRQRTMEEWKGRLISFGLETLGGFLVAVALDCFAVNAAFPLTGFSGIALIVNRLWGLPIGATTVLLNIPLAFLCYKLLGRGFFLRSMRCMVISSIFIDYIGPMLPAYDGDRLLAALCTGVTMGVGYALTLDKLADERPEDAKRLRTFPDGGREFEIPKRWVKVNASRILTEEQKASFAARLTKA